MYGLVYVNVYRIYYNNNVTLLTFLHINLISAWFWQFNLDFFFAVCLSSRMRIHLHIHLLVVQQYGNELNLIDNWFSWVKLRIHLTAKVNLSNHTIWLALSLERWPEFLSVFIISWWNGYTEEKKKKKLPPGDSSITNTDRVVCRIWPESQLWVFHIGISCEESERHSDQMSHGKQNLLFLKASTW